VNDAHLYPVLPGSHRDEFRCERCGHSNNEIQSAGKIRSEGTCTQPKSSIVVTLTASSSAQKLVRSMSAGPSTLP
jgi:hypothetical protein